MRAFDAVSMNRVPQFIQDDYPALNEFIEAYYEWLTETQIDRADFKSIRDIDKTLDEYLVYFKNTLAKGLPDNTAADYRTVIKHIRSMFKAKGTEKSIKFFFKALFNEEVDIFYPRTQMFVPSDSTWVRNRVLKVEIGDAEVSTVIGKELSFTHGSLYVADGYKVGTVAVLSVSDIIGNIEAVSSVFLNETEYTIKKQVVGVDVLTPGESFALNDNYTLLNGVVVSVKETLRGPVTQIDVVDGGSGYTGEEEIHFLDTGPYGKTLGRGGKAIIDTIGPGGTITSIRVLSGGSLYDLPPGIFVESTSGDDAILRASGTLGGLKHLQIVDGGMDLPETPWEDVVADATVRVVYGNVAELEGSFNETSGFLSSNSAYLQDEHYYQYFSYVIKTGINLDQYATIFKQMIHPSGMKMFSSFTISTILKALSRINTVEAVLVIAELSGERALDRGSLLRLYVTTYVHAGALKHNQVDVFKYAWFNESSYINRFKDLKIRDYCNSSSINPTFEKNTNMQPDLIVKHNILPPIPGFGNTIGNDDIGSTRVG